MLIAFFIPPGGHTLEFAGPGDVFVEANRQLGRALYDISYLSEEERPLSCLSGLRVLPDRTIYDRDEPIDTLLVTGPRDPPGSVSPALVEWLRRRVPSTRRYGAVCTGAFLLGAAGLLDHRRVTTHWEYAPALAAAFPSATVEPDHIFVRDGAMFTSAGVSAGIDLALALVEEDLGHDLALAVARWLVVFLKRPGGQSQFSIELATQAATGSPIQHVQQWLRDNAAARPSVRQLAERAGMGERTFARAFRRETGMTPADYLEAVRVDMARRRLEQSNLPLQRVAALCGLCYDSSYATRLSSKARRQTFGLSHPVSVASRVTRCSRLHDGWRSRKRGLSFAKYIGIQVGRKRPQFVWI
jgi:transcriptional regulator GlxA family with amidase domain